MGEEGQVRSGACVDGVWFDRLTRNASCAGTDHGAGSPIRQAQGRLPADAGMTGRRMGRGGGRGGGGDCGEPGSCGWRGG